MLVTRPKGSALATALSIAAGLMLPGLANAAEAILFDGNNCSGEYRMTDRSISDFNQIDFDNEVNSLMVITGSFRFYRDANYGEANGPSFQLGPSGYQETCWSLAEASNNTFPNNRMSAVQLVQDSGAPQPDGVAILYDFENFGGEYRILTRNVSDFHAIGFDNDVESIRVVSGSWTFFRNANYGAPPNRPSITLGPGDYPDVANVPGYPPGTFPGDLMSSAQVAADATPPPPPEPQCVAGEVQGDTQCIPCAQFNAVPSPDGGSCVCPEGYEVTNVGFLDGIQIEICQQQQAPPPVPECPGPYQYLDPATNQCAFNCHQSTQPNPQTGQCDCLPGTQEAGSLNDGRRYCLGIQTPGDQPAQIQRYTVPADQLIPAAQAAGFTMTAQSNESGALCQVQGNTLVFQTGLVTQGRAPTCTVTLFGGRSLAPGWSFEDYNANVVSGQANPTGLTAQLPFQIRMVIPPMTAQTVVEIQSVDLMGPAGQSWQQALQ